MDQKIKAISKIYHFNKKGNTASKEHMAKADIQILRNGPVIFPLP